MNEPIKVYIYWNIISIIEWAARQVVRYSMLSIIGSYLRQIAYCIPTCIIRVVTVTGFNAKKTNKVRKS